MNPCWIVRHFVPVMTCAVASLVTSAADAQVWRCNHSSPRAHSLSERSTYVSGSAEVDAARCTSLDLKSIPFTIIPADSYRSWYQARAVGYESAPERSAHPAADKMGFALPPSAPTADTESGEFSLAEIDRALSNLKNIASLREGLERELDQLDK